MASLTAINSLGDYAHNPRGNIWYNDESTYGHKLLLKMGWNKGKGLGKNENGIKENVKVKFRNTNSGLGFKDDAYNNIMKTDYESILKNLNAEYSHDKSTPEKEIDKQEKNYDQRSKVVKSKLRYPKLFFGKDVTKYSEKDMKSIFICSLPFKDHEKKETQDLIISQKEISEIESPKSNCLTISDYFNKKMKEKKNNILHKEVDSSPDHQHASTESTNLKSDNLNNNKSGSSKRKKKHFGTDINEEVGIVLDSHQNISDCQDLETENLDFIFEKKSSKKKKRKSKMNANKDDSFQKCVNSNELESDNVMKQNLLEVPACENSISGNNKIPNDDFCRPSKKRKTTRILESGNSSVTSCELLSKSIKSEAELSSKVIKEKKKKKKSLNVDLSPFENPVSGSKETLEIFKTIDDSFSEPKKTKLSSSTVHSKKNKKLKRKLKQKLKSCLNKKSGSYSLKRVSFNESVSYRIIDTEFESVQCLADEESSLGVDTSVEIINIDDINSSEDELCETSNTDNSTSIEDVLCETTNIDDNNSSDVPCSVKNECSDESCTEKEENTSDEHSDQEYTLSCLPSSKSSNYNCWIESQRQALGMKLYKNMLKNIKNHKILGTTNLLSIKGYGNWGFK